MATEKPPTAAEKAMQEALEKEIMGAGLAGRANPASAPPTCALPASPDGIDVLDLDSLNAAAQAVTARASDLDAKLAVLRERSAIAAGRALPTLREQRDGLLLTQNGLHALTRELTASSQAARASSARLRAAFESRERIAQARNMIEELLGLEECAGDVKAAIARCDYSSAVKRIAPLARALDADEDAIDPEGREGSKMGLLPSGSVDKAEESLAHRASQEGERAAEVVDALRSQLAVQLEAAAQGSDVGAVCTFVRLLGELGRAQDGEQVLLEFAYRQLEIGANEDVAPSTTASASAALGRMLQRCAVLLETTDTVLAKDTVSKAAFASLIRTRCVHLGTKLGLAFNRAAGLRAMVDTASRKLQRANAASTNQEAVLDSEGSRLAMECEPTLDAMCALLRGVIQWDAYMSDRVGSHDEVKASTDDGKRLRHAAPFSEMARCTVTVSHFWTYAAVSRAIKAPTGEGAFLDGDDPTGEGTASGMPEKVDSAFYVLQTSLRRGSYTCDGGIASASVTHAGTILMRIVLAVLKAHVDREGAMASKLAGAMAGAALAGAQNITQKISAAEGSLGGAGSRAAAEAAGFTGRLADASRHVGLLRTLSALHLCVTYTPRLLNQAEQDFAAALPPPALANAAAQLGAAASVSASFADALKAGLSRLCVTLLPRLQKRVDVLASASYTLQTEAAFAAAEGDTFVVGFLNELEATVKQLSPALVEGARDELCSMLVKSCIERIEGHLIQKKFDQLGALQLDRDVRALTKRLSELITHSVREHLTRLSQMSAVLNVEAEAEAVEIQEAAGWRLGGAEMKQLLALRVDFRSEIVEHLPLRP